MEKIKTVGEAIKTLDSAMETKSVDDLLRVVKYILNNLSRRGILDNVLDVN